MDLADADCNHCLVAELTSQDVRISLLGGVRVHIGDGGLVDPLPRKCQELLAALALDPGSAITVGRLVSLIWGDDPPRTAEKTLQTYVARLRRELGSQAIIRTGAAYRLDVDPASIDTARFRGALAIGNLDAALREWTGPPLAGIDSEGLRPLVDALTEEWLEAVELSLERSIETDPGSSVGRLTGLVADYPFREGLWALLMIALYRSGRQAEALDTYRRARTLLVEELGVEPGPRLRDLEQLVLRQDDELGTPIGLAPRRGRAPNAPTGTLTFGFVELDDAAGLWSEHGSTAADVVSALVDAATDLAEDHDGLVFSGRSESPGVAFDRAADACAWAVSLHQTVETTQWPHGHEVAVRIGLHTGEADERNGSYYGPTVTFTQRLATVAAPGQTVATAVTALLSGVESVTLGTFIFDGIRGERDLCQIGPGSFPRPQIGFADVDQIPRPAHSLLGRDGLVERVSAALSQAQIVTLVGPGGIGKTRLAIEVTRRRDPTSTRAWFVNLADVSTSTEVERTLADTIGARESSDRTLQDAIAATLDARPTLVVLDNCEHVIDGVTQLANDLVQRCPTAKFLATSREGLGIPAEQVLPIGPLDAATAGVDLFMERAHALDPELRLDSKAVEAVCRRLDGVPLAIELAATTSRSMTPADLLARLDNMFSLLSGSRRRTLERHRTLRATIQWSYDLLSVNEQLLFQRLAIFSGSFDLRAVEAIVADHDLPANDVGALLSDLVDRSMCTVESGAAGRRFRLLEPMRQFGLEELHNAESNESLHRRHAEHVYTRLSDLRDLLAGPDEIEGVVQLAELWPNLRGAIDYAIDSDDLQLATELVEAVAAQGYLRRGLGEIGDWIERILDYAEPSDHHTIGFGLLWTSLYAQVTENRNTYDRLVAPLGSPETPFGSLASSIMNGDSDAVLACMPDALSVAQQRTDRLLPWILHIINDGNLLASGRLDEAQAHLASIIDQETNTLPPTLLSWAIFMFAAIEEIQGRHADQHYDRIAQMTLPPRSNSPAPSLAARRSAALGDSDRAFTMLREHVDDLTAGNNPNGALIVARELVNILVIGGRMTEAAALLGHLDAAGVDEIPGFGSLLAEARALVDANPTTAEIRATTARAADRPHNLLPVLTQTLDTLLVRS